MRDLLEPMWWQMHLQDLELWWFDEVMAPPTLVQLALIAAVFLVARSSARQAQNLLQRMRTATARVPAFIRVWAALDTITVPLTWLLMQWLAIALAKSAGWPHPLLNTTASLLSAWVVIRLASHWVDNPLWSRLLVYIAWTLAALNILGLLPQTMDFLDAFAITLGTVRVSVLTLLQGGITFGLMLWLAVGTSGLIERKLRGTSVVSPAARVLLAKLVRVALIAMAVLIALNSMGIDLTAFAVLSGALAVGLGFGLQKIFSNLVSGVILLLDKSIKPGDVIAVGQTYGWIDHLGARYVSIVTRDGVEHLIPNEELITRMVENWSHSSNLVRLRVPVGVSYNADPRLAMALCVDAAQMVPRVLLDPAPSCLMRGFGASSLDLELRVWISDPENGRGSVISGVLLGIWDRFQEHGIEIPFAQQDLHIRTILGEDETGTLREHLHGNCGPGAVSGPVQGKTGSTD